MKNINRRAFLREMGVFTVAAGLPVSFLNCQNREKTKMQPHVISQKIFIPSPEPGIAIHAASYYTTLTGKNLMSVHGYINRSDTVNVAFLRFSDDNGKTWGNEIKWPTEFRHPAGTGRRHHRGGYVDPKTGHFLTFWVEGILPSDEPLEGLRQWKIHYAVSEDGGTTWLVNEQIIHEGDEFNAQHPLPGVFIGKNCVMMGDLGERPLTRSDGVILLPVQSSPLGPDGEYYNPGGGYTYTDSLVLLGRWQPDKRLAWTASQRVQGDPARSTRGMIEPTLAELEDGTLIMVMRGSNDRRPELPGYKWISRSADGGETWTNPVPWTYSSGYNFFSPSSCSQLLRHSDGRLFWMGNIVAENPKGNLPRYPIVLGEVDNKTGLLIQKSVTIIDDLQPDDSKYLLLSNFYMREERGTKNLLLHLTRLFAQDFRTEGIKRDWTADALIYRIAV